jgi:hypothetical protein
MIEEDALEIANALQKKGCCCWSLYEQFIEDAKIILNSFQS